MKSGNKWAIYILAFGTLALASGTNCLNYQTIVLPDQDSQPKKCLNCYIVKVRDEYNSLYLVKQYKHGSRSTLAATSITELVAVEIGLAAGVRLNEVSIIPAQVAFLGKNTHMPATVHTRAPGIQFNTYKGTRYKGMTLLQTARHGLTREVIYHMSRNKDLPPLVALDTFVGNVDRGVNNYFYDKRTDSFTGIDLGASYASNLCQLALGSIQDLIQGQKEYLSQEELNGLMLYYDTLSFLVHSNTPETMSDLFDMYAQQTRLFDKALFGKQTQRKWQSYITRCKSAMYSSYPYAQKLLEALEQLFRQVADQ